jgi:hypothetical protein
VLPRSALANLAAEQTRRPERVALLESQTGSRIAELTPIRYGRMSRSRFAFFAGRCCSRRSWSSTSTISTRRCQVTADVAFTRFAEAYADRNEHDYATLCGA